MFSGAKKFRGHSPQTINIICSGHCGQKLYAGSRGRPAENLALLDKICIFCISFVIYQFSPLLQQNLVGWCPKFGTILAHLLQMKYVQPFRNYVLQINGGSAEVRWNLRFPHQIFKGGVKKNFTCRFSGLTPYQTSVQISLWSIKGRLRSIV